MNKAFTKKQSNFDDFMSRLEDLLRKNKGSALYEGYDVNPNAMLLPGKVMNPTGMGNQQYTGGMQFSQYFPESMPFNAPNVGAVAPYSEDSQNMTPAYTGGQGQTQNISAQDFFNQVAQSIYAPKMPSQQSSEELERIYQQTGQKYAVQSLPTGEVRYNDGSVGQMEQNAQPIASMADGNVLWSDGFVRQSLPDYMQGSGVDALSMGLFGGKQTVTQPYGNYNPIEPTRGHINVGTDFRTRNLQQHEIRNFFAEPLEVVEIYNQARPGSGRVGNYENRGYGNSILLRRPDGTMIRVSHFDNLGDFKAGDQIMPGQSIGVPGATGNVTGEHADVEVYSPDGRIISPDQFMAKVSESSTSSEPLYRYEAPKAGEPSQQEPQMSVAPEAHPLTQAVQEARQLVDKYRPQAQQVNQAVQQVPQQVGALAGKAIENTAQQAGLEAELGASEGLVTPEAKQARINALATQPKQYNPYRQLAGNVLEQVGDVGQAIFPGVWKEGAMSEAVAGGPTVHTGQALASEIGGPKPQEIPDIKQNIADIGKDVVSRNPFKKVSSIVQQVGDVGEDIKVGTDQLIQKAKDFAGGVKMPGMIQKQSALDIDPNNKVVGDVGGESQTMSMMPTKSGDTRDAFFKYGGSKDFAKYLKPNAEEMYGGALNLNLFNQDFFKNPGAVGAVFGKTAMGKDATGRFKDYLQGQIPEDVGPEYTEEVRKDGDSWYKYMIPNKKYFEAQFWKDKLANTPDVLSGDFSYDEFSSPTIKRQSLPGERQTISGDAPTFKSNAVSLFSEAGDRAGKLVKGINQKLGSMYKPHPFSKVVSMPRESGELMSTLNAPGFENMTPNYDLPEVRKVFLRREQPKPQPSLQDYLNQGKTAAEWYAETGRQSELDAMQSHADTKIDLRTGQRQMPGGQPHNDSGRQMSVGRNQGVTNSIRAAAQGHTYVSPSGNKIPNYTPSNPNMSDASTGLPVRGEYHPPQTQSNPFKRIWGRVKKWF